MELLIAVDALGSTSKYCPLIVVKLSVSVSLANAQLTFWTDRETRYSKLLLPRMVYGLGMEGGHTLGGVVCH